jgi:peroxiredoxin
MSVTIGEVAPQFTLFNTEKEAISLADYQGKKRLLLFFPLAFTGVCTEELCSVRDDIAFYDGLDAEIFAISVDSLFTLERFKEDMKVQYHMLSDFNKEVSRMYDCIHETFAFDMQGVSKRSAFVIDQEGVIRYAEVLDNPGNVPNFEAIKEVLASL